MLYYGINTKAWFKGLDEATKIWLKFGNILEAAAADRVKAVRQKCAAIGCTCPLNFLMTRGCTCGGK